MGSSKLKKKEKKLKEKLNKIRGEILSDTIEIEFFLTERIHKFFHPKQDYRGTAFYWHILNTRKFSFEDKIRLFKKIPYFKRLKSYDSIKKSLRFAQRLRNQLAHWELLQNKSELDHLVLQGPITVKEVIIDDKLLEKFEKHKDFLLSKL